MLLQCCIARCSATRRDVQLCSKGVDAAEMQLRCCAAGCMEGGVLQNALKVVCCRTAIEEDHVVMQLSKGQTCSSVRFLATACSVSVLRRSGLGRSASITAAQTPRL